MCVCGGGGAVTSFKVINFPKFQGVQNMLSGEGGRGASNVFSKGMESNFLAIELMI